MTNLLKYSLSYIYLIFWFRHRTRSKHPLPPSPVFAPEIHSRCKIYRAYNAYSLFIHVLEEHRPNHPSTVLQYISQVKEVTRPNMVKHYHAMRMMFLHCVVYTHDNALLWKKITLFSLHKPISFTNKEISKWIFANQDVDHLGNPLGPILQGFISYLEGHQYCPQICW